MTSTTYGQYMRHLAEQAAPCATCGRTRAEHAIWYQIAQSSPIPHRTHAFVPSVPALYDPTRELTEEEIRCPDCGFISRLGTLASVAHDNCCDMPLSAEDYQP